MKIRFVLPKLPKLPWWNMESCKISNYRSPALNSVHAIGDLIGLSIFIIIFTMSIPVVAIVTANATSSVSSVSNAGGALTSMVTLIFVTMGIIALIKIFG